MKITDTNVPFEEGVSADASASNVSHTGVACADKLRGTIYLQTANIEVRGKGGTATATVLFDSGSDRSYISSSLADKIQPEWVGSKALSYAAFGTWEPSKCLERGIFQIYLKDTQGVGTMMQVMEVPVICAPMYRVVLPEVFGS